MKQKLAERKNCWLIKCLAGLSVSCISALTITIIGTMLVLSEKLSISSMNVSAVAVQFVAVFLGVLCTGKLVTEKKIAASFVVMLSYYFILISCTILLWNGQFEGVVSNILSGTLGGGIAFLLSIKQKTAKKRYTRKGLSR